MVRTYSQDHKNSVANAAVGASELHMPDGAIGDASKMPSTLHLNRVTEEREIRHACRPSLVAHSARSIADIQDTKAALERVADRALDADDGADARGDDLLDPLGARRSVRLESMNAEFLILWSRVSVPHP